MCNLVLALCDTLGFWGQLRVWGVITAVEVSAKQGKRPD